MHASVALAETDHQTLRVPLFESAVVDLDDEARHVLVDCGPPRSGLIDLLSGFRCRLDVLDLPGRMAELDQLAEDIDLAAWFDQFCPPANHEPVDLILCWNLLDYLKPEQIGVLMARLIERLRPGGKLHALVEYASPKMPASPVGMAPMGKTALTLELDSQRNRAAPRHSRGALEKLMPGLQAERSMLLSNGMQEYLFRRSS